MKSILLSCSCLLALAVPAGAQTLSPEYRALLNDALVYEDGAHFDATARLVARSIEAAPGDIAAELTDDLLLETRFREALNLPHTPDTAELVSAAAADAAADGAAYTSAVPAVAEEAPVSRNTGGLRGLAYALTHSASDGVWSGKVRAGLQWDSGNTSQLDYTLGLDVERSLVGWGFKGSLEYAYAESRRATGRVATRDRLRAKLRGERELDARWSVYGVTNFERDKLSSWSDVAFVGAGLGYRISPAGDFLWSVRAAPGFQMQNPAGPGGWETEFAVELGSEIDWALNPGVMFEADSMVTFSDSTRAEQRLALSTGIAAGWGAETAFTYRYDFDPRDDFKHTDTRLVVSLTKTF